MESEVIRKEPYRSFISMDMTSKDYINFVTDEPFFEDCSHTFTLHEMCFVTVVDWNVHKDNEPRGLLPVNPL